MNDVNKLANLTLAPYIIKATALIGVSRKVGGNQFRHVFATLGILLDYKYFGEDILLKASLLHDLVEDVPATDIHAIRCIEPQAGKVVDLMLEVTRSKTESREEYLKRILEHGSRNAKLLKVADRISNLTDLHRDIFSENKMMAYLSETEKFIIPMAKQVNLNMVIELKDLIQRKREYLKALRQK